jgi:hypothetical protein
MHIYKFRILSDEDENFIRDIEIKSTHSYEDFHQAILDSIGFIGQELASFYICDRKWNKNKEITLLDMTDEGVSNVSNAKDEAEDEDDEKIAVIPMFIMRDSKINKFIDDPHQRMIYEYDFLNLRTFYIELMKVHEAEEGISYPRCTLIKGSISEFPETQIGIPDDIDDELTGDFEEIKSEFSEENFSEFDNDLEIR